MSRLSNLGINTLYVFIGNAGAKLVSIIMLPFYTYWLSVEEYGVVDMISVYSTLCMGLVSCCIYDSIFIFPKGQTFDRQKEYFSSGFIFLLITALIAIFLSYILNVLSIQLDIQNVFFLNIFYICSILISSYVQYFTQEFCRSIEKMKVYSLSGVILTVSMALSAFILLPKYGIKGYVVSVVISNIITISFSVKFAGMFKYLCIYSMRRSCLVEMLKYSIPLIPNTVMWWIIGSCNRPIMESYLGVYSIGVLAVANKFPNLINSFITLFTKAWQISVMEEYNKPDFNVFFYNILCSISFVMGILTIIVGLSSFLLVEVFSSNRFIDAWHYIPILCMGILFSCISALSGTLYSALRTSKYYFYSTVIAAFAAVISNFVLIPLIGIYGASISVVVSFLLMALSRLYYCNKYVKLTKVRDLLKVTFYPVLILAIVPSELSFSIKAILTLFLLMTYLYRNLYIAKKAVNIINLHKF